MPGKPLTRDFYTRDTLTVAQALLGQRLVRLWQGERLSGRIVEVEAYVGAGDQSSHARCGLTARNAPMFGPPGHTYVYLIYGMYHCLNLVTERAGYPAAILIRALEPLEGVETQLRLRPARKLSELLSGPGRLCQALSIDRQLNAMDVCTGEASLWVEADGELPAAAIATGPRIGVRGDVAAINAPWRYTIANSPWVSKRKA